MIGPAGDEARSAQQLRLSSGGAARAPVAYECFTTLAVAGFALA